MIPGGGLHDLEALARHFYYQGQRENNNSQLPLAFLGACSVAIGATMLWSAYQKHTKFVDGLRRSGNHRAEPASNGRGI